MQDIVDFLNKNSGALSTFFSAIVTAATVISVYLTVLLLKESREVRRAQITPQILISVQPEENNEGYIDMVIQNIGSGVAKNIRFQVDQSIKILKDYKISDINLFSSGIPHLGPSNKLSFFFTSLIGQQMIKSIPITVAYEDVLGKQYYDTYIIDFNQFTGILFSNGPPLKDIARSVDKIAKAIDHSSTGFRALNIVTESRDELHSRQRKARYERRHRASMSETPVTTTDQDAPDIPDSPIGES